MMILSSRRASLLLFRSMSMRWSSNFVEQVQVDAFTLQRFGGNPAAVVYGHKDEEWMQKLSNENNIGATVFLDKHLTEKNTYNLRWFTANKELDLCGHGTLAAAHSLYESKRVSNKLERIYFHSIKSGTLSAIGQSDGTIQLDFPATPPSPYSLSVGDIQKLVSAFGIVAEDVLYAGRTAYDLFAELKPAAFGSLSTINYSDLEYFGGRGVIITCRGGHRLSDSDEDDLIGKVSKDSVVYNREYDFLSRMFLPRFGTNEDWATGSSHCALTPYWLEKFNSEAATTDKGEVKSLVGYQASMRGGTMYVSMNSEGRVLLAGHCVTTIHSKVIC